MSSLVRINRARLKKSKDNFKKRHASQKVSPYSVALYAIAILGIASMVIIYLSMCAKTISCQYQISRMKETKATLERERVTMKLEVNRLSSLERIETIAEKELGMAHPPNRLILDMRNPAVLQASLEDVVAIGNYRKTDSR